ncbi:MAG TPA: carbohydrate-binding domain-containing protein [Firmicutes bacterium]|nr:carbohydrate-binding domain-containing protein [Bacillota bacterium]
MKHKKYIAIALTALLTFGSAQTALAAVIYHDLSTKGDLKISSPGDEYVVTSSGESPTGYTIIVDNGVVTHIVLNGVNIETTDENGIKIGSNANVVLELDGTNSITVNTESYDTAKSGINVAEGTLTITGGEYDSLDVKVIDKGYPSDGADGAAIGSDEGEKFNGTIIIEGGNITAVSEYGAGIGSGYDSEMSGSINISGGEVEASSSYGAGIGSGDYGEMSGSITISGGEVTASSNDNGAGIGSGWDGEMSGSITISGGEVTASSNYNGAGIGSGYGDYGEMSGSITISGGEVTASSNDNGAGIGSGWDGEMSGTITISDGEVTASSYYFGAGIGAGDYGDITESGSITIGGDADVTVSSALGPGIGSGDYGNMDGKITITDNAKVDITLGYYDEYDERYYHNNVAIGSGDYTSYYEFTGSINIHENANVTMGYIHGDGTPTIGSSNPEDDGSSTGSISLSTGAMINGTPGSDVEMLKDMGILDSNATIETVEPTVEPELVPDSRSTFDLKQLNLVQRINEAEDGEVVAVSEKQLSKGKLPAYALEALAKKENVTLAILCEKFDILIPSEDAVDDAGSTQFYTIDELVEMYE